MFIWKKVKQRRRIDVKFMFAKIDALVITCQPINVPNMYEQNVFKLMAEERDRDILIPSVVLLMRGVKGWLPVG